MQDSSTLIPRRLGALGTGIGARHADVVRLVSVLDGGFATTAGLKSLVDRLPRAGVVNSKFGTGEAISLGLPVEQRFGLMALIGTQKISALIGKAEALRASAEALVPDVLVDLLQRGLQGYINEQATGYAGPAPFRQIGAEYQRQLADAQRRMMEDAAPDAKAIRADLAALGAYDLRTQAAWRAVSFLGKGLRLPIPGRFNGESMEISSGAIPIFMDAIPEARPDRFGNRPRQSMTDLFLEPLGCVQFSATLADRMLIVVSAAAFAKLHEDQRAALGRDPSFNEETLLDGRPLLVPDWVEGVCSGIEGRLLDAEAAMRVN